MDSLALSNLSSLSQARYEFFDLFLRLAGTYLLIPASSVCTNLWLLRGLPVRPGFSVSGVDD